MPQLSLFGASGELRQSQPPSNPKSSSKQSPSPQPQARRIACYVIHQVATQPAPETANPLTFLAFDGSCLKYQKLLGIPVLAVHLGSAPKRWGVASIRFKALSQSQGGGQ